MCSLHRVKTILLTGVSAALLALLLLHSGAGSAQTISPAATPAPRPQGSAHAYTLNQWTEVDAQAAVEAMEAETRRSVSDWNAFTRYSRMDYLHAAKVLRAENLLRFPGAQAYDDWLFGVYDPQKSSLRWYYDQWTAPPERLIERVEAGLNSGELTPENMAEWFAQRRIFLTEFGEQGHAHLFGDELPGRLYQLDQFEWALMVALEGRAPGEYSLHLITADWYYLHFLQVAVSTVDLTGDGQAEVLVDVTSHPNGSYYSCYQYLDAFTWNGTRFVKLPGASMSISGMDSGRCNGFQVHEAGGSATITSSEVEVLSCGSDAEPYVYERIAQYRWNGAAIERTAETVTPPEFGERRDCAAEWALWAGPRSEEALEILRDVDNNWPAELEDAWGPGARDYFRIRLGIQEAFQGNREPAVEHLQRVIDTPATEFDFPSRLAQQFMAGYANDDLYAGCGRVASWITGEARKIQTGDQQTISMDQMRAAWGIADPRWQFGWNLEDGFNHCPLETAFRVSIGLADIHSRADLSRWLYNHQLTFTGLREGDLNGDGRADWMALIQVQPGSDLSLWALVQEQDGIRAVPIQGSSPATVDSPTAWNRVRPPGSSLDIQVYQHHNRLEVFTLEPTGNGHRVVRRARGTIGGVRWFDARGDQISVVRTNGRMSTYVWNAGSQQFEQSPEPPGQAERINRMGRVLFNRGDAAEALALVQESLRMRVEEDLPRPLYDNGLYLPRRKPYLMYMLGLSFELTGEETKAVQAYHQLWSEYPDNPYAVLASMKLEMKP